MKRKRNVGETNREFRERDVKTVEWTGGCI